jgi:hypothetical protein
MKFKQVLSFAARAVIVALGYTLALIAAGVVMGMLGLLSGTADERAIAALQWTFLASIVAAVVMGLAAERVSASFGRHILVWGSLFFLNIATVTIEGKFFAPELVPDLGIVLVQQLVACLVVAVLVTWLFAKRQPATAIAHPSRPWTSWLSRFGLSALSYLLFYFVFGAINFALVTRPYYEATGTALAVPEPQLVLVAELVRAPLMVLSLLPFILTARMSSRQLATWSGVLLFVIGGIVPLIWQAVTLPGLLLIASGVEILCQNFLTGFVTAVLLSRPTVTSSRPSIQLQGV